MIIQFTQPSQEGTPPQTVYTLLDRIAFVSK
jgi:hypothetical protein